MTSKQREDLDRLENKYNDRNFYCTNMENSYKHLKCEIEALKKANDRLRLDLEGAEVDVLNYSSKNSDLAQEKEKLLTIIDNMDYYAFKAKNKAAVNLKIAKNVVDFNTTKPITTDFVNDYEKPEKQKKNNEAPVYDIEELSQGIKLSSEMQPKQDTLLHESAQPVFGIEISNKPPREERPPLVAPSFTVDELRPASSAQSKQSAQETARVEGVPKVEEEQMHDKQQIQENAQTKDKQQPKSEVQTKEMQPMDGQQVEERPRSTEKIHSEGGRDISDNELKPKSETLSNERAAQSKGKPLPEDDEDWFAVDEKPQVKADSLREENKEDEWLELGEKPQAEEVDREEKKLRVGRPSKVEDMSPKDEKFQPEEKVQSDENLRLSVGRQDEGLIMKGTPSHSFPSPGTPEPVYRMGQGVTTDLADIYKNEDPGASLIPKQAQPDIHKMCQSVITFKEKEVKESEESMVRASERRYRNCLVSAKGEWYNSQWLEIAIERSVNKGNKYVECILVFKNKSVDTPIYVTTFEPVSYDSNGNSLLPLIGLSVSVDSVPKEIPANGQAEGSITLSALNLFMIDIIVKLEYRYFFYRILRAHELLECLIKLPVNVFMFCKELDISREEYDKTLEELESEKLDGGFTLDISRLGPTGKIENLLSMNKNAKILPFKDTKTICAATEYEDDLGKLSAFIEIKANKVGQSYLSVYSEDQTFSEVITRDLLNLLAQI
eukprot:TRINITY_DN317_c0_g1_i12.p1 TRINITY_DN317_c0_g1~~TRINITY_DN317_c0_g1_i12.p1  ORF type:complete len:722 (+),score=204.90 TRINITY_DN317_c0_g1_i12:975-3140(+)